MDGDLLSVDNDLVFRRQRDPKSDSDSPTSLRAVQPAKSPTGEVENEEYRAASGKAHPSHIM
jgi:hypothetical protein